MFIQVFHCPLYTVSDDDSDDGQSSDHSTVSVLHPSKGSALYSDDSCRLRETRVQEERGKNCIILNRY